MAGQTTTATVCRECAPSLSTADGYGSTSTPTPTVSYFVSTISTSQDTSSSSTSQSSTVTPTQSTTPTAVIATANSSSKADAGTIAGCVIGGVVFLAFLLLGALLYLRARKRRRTPPSSEFMNSLKDGGPPVLRLDSGAEYSPALPEKSGLYYPPTAPSAYYASPPLQDVKYADEVMMSDVPSQRQSIEELPLRPQRYSSQSHVPRRHQPSDSLTSWGREMEVVEELASSPPRDVVSHFVPRISLDDVSQRPPNSSRLSLQPLRRRPDPEDS